MNHFKPIGLLEVSGTFKLHSLWA